jgi:hypothetical protein
MSMKAIWPLALAFLASVTDGRGVTLFSDVHSPKDCGESVHVETNPSRREKGLVSVLVTFRPTVPDQYRGRVKAFGEFVVMSGGRTIAVSRLESAGKDGVFTFAFELARDAFPHSEFTVSSQLFENGMAVLGGGEVYRLHLEGFQPGAGAQSTAEPGAPPKGGPSARVGSPERVEGGPR